MIERGLFFVFGTDLRLFARRSVDVKRTSRNLCVAKKEELEEEVQHAEEHQRAVVVLVVLQNETGDPEVVC